ncbi:DUF6906 family protein [Aneurinibacillus aneurinilyticus]|uniref:DUF6906 family protein n=1 Tax=Aneurinibacillus aneurinilyticus TaxID=1391 RepID=UPI003524CCD3
MKQGRKPTRKQKLAMKAVRLNPENWLVTKNLPGELHLVHRETDSRRTIPIGG